MKARIFLDVAQQVDAVAHHQSHRAGVVIGPHRLGAAALFDLEKILGDHIERVVPGNAAEFARPLLADPLQRMHQPFGVMLALGVAGDLGADHAGGVVVVF